MVRFLKTQTWVHVLGLVLVGLWVWPLGAWVPITDGLDAGWAMAALILTLPAVQSAAVNVVSLLLPLRRKETLRDLPDIRTLGTLFICVVSKGENREALRRTVEAIAPLLRERSSGDGRSDADERLRLDVVTDLEVDLPHMRVPREFTTKHARFKARALEYYRQVAKFGEHDWVLHLDEETIVDQESLEACIRFAKRSPYPLGQGVIFYNNYRFWRNPLTAAADAIRTADDMARFFGQFAWWHRPVFGVHGSFLLVKGTLENELTWDWPEWLVEDYTFSVHAMNRGYGCGFIDGYAREQSPQTVLDLMRQRRRWVVGMRQLVAHSIWPAMWVTFWLFAPIARVGVIALTAMDMGPGWLLWPAQVAYMVSLYLYLLGTLVQSVDTGSGAVVTAVRVAATFVLYHVVVLIESAATVWAMFTRGSRLGFQVVKK